MLLTEYKLSDIGTVITGKTPPGSKDESFGGNVFFLTPTDMDGARTPSKIERTLSDLGKQQLQRLIVPRGVAVSCIGSQMGKSCLLKSPFATNQQINTIVPNESKVDLDFLYYLLSSMREYLFRLGVGAGSTMPILNKGNFENIAVFIPELSDQKKIAAILSILDDKIELNNQINETLESMAKAIFKEWFIDFGPVKAKAEGKKPFGMDDETASLFPDSFEDSELGPIPKGWKICELDSISEILNGFAFKSEDYQPSGVFVLRTKNFNEQGFADKLHDDVFLSEEKAKEYESYYVQPFDIHLVMVAASIGKTSITPPSLLPALRNQNMWCFRNKTSFPYRHTLNLIVPLVSNDLKGFSSGSARDFFRKGDFQKYQLILPPENLLAKAEGIFKSIFEMIASNISENASLAKTRDLLLPKLISGEISLNDV